jgi:hypothetical protein
VPLPQTMGVQLAVLAVATLLLSLSSDSGWEKEQVPRGGKILQRVQLRRIWSGLEHGPEGAENKDQFSAVDWLARDNQRARSGRCFGLFGARENEDMEESEEEDLSSGEDLQAIEGTDVRRREWMLRAFCCLFCGQWHMLSASSRARAQVLRRPKWPSEGSGRNPLASAQMRGPPR